MVARTGREFAVAQGAQLPAERLLGDGDAELLEYPMRQIDQPPAHDAVDRRDWAALDHPHNGLVLHIIELRGLTRRFAVQETVGTPHVEPQHPIPDDLKSDAADLRGLCLRRAVLDRSKRQQAPSLRVILRLLRKAPQPQSVEISTKQYRHGVPPSFATLNQSRDDFGTSKESRFQGFGISPRSIGVLKDS